MKVRARRLASFAGMDLEDFAPIWGSANMANKALDQKDYLGFLVNAGFCGFEVFSFGTASFLTKTEQIAARVLERQLLGKSNILFDSLLPKASTDISEVAVNNTWLQQTGKAGAMFTKSGQPVKFMIDGVYEGVKIRVIATHADIITAFPIK